MNKVVDLGRIFAQVCLCYHWTLHYCLDSLTLPQVMFFHKQAVLFYNPDASEEPDKEKIKRLYGESRTIRR